MAYIGRFQLGEILPLRLQCRTTAATEVSPTNAPTYQIYKTNDTAVVAATKLAPYIKGALTGWFVGEEPLDSTFSAGRYNVVYTWASGGSTYRRTDTFEVTAGGNSSGQYLGLRFARYPHADYVIGLTDLGTLEQRRNPRAE